MAEIGKGPALEGAGGSVSPQQAPGGVSNTEGLGEVLQHLESAGGYSIATGSEESGKPAQNSDPAPSSDKENTEEGKMSNELRALKILWRSLAAASVVTLLTEAHLRYKFSRTFGDSSPSKGAIELVEKKHMHDELDARVMIARGELSRYVAAHGESEETRIASDYIEIAANIIETSRKIQGLGDGDPSREDLRNQQMQAAIAAVEEMVQGVIGNNGR